jgi:hypothetical protein
MPTETYVESIAGEIVNQELGEIAEYISVHSKRARSTYLIVDQLNTEGIREEQDSLIFGIVYGRCRDVALDAGDRFPFTWCMVIHCKDREQERRVRKYLRQCLHG